MHKSLQFTFDCNLVLVLALKIQFSKFVCFYIIPNKGEIKKRLCTAVRLRIQSVCSKKRNRWMTMANRSILILILNPLFAVKRFWLTSRIEIKKDRKQEKLSRFCYTDVHAHRHQIAVSRQTYKPKRKDDSYKFQITLTAITTSPKSRWCSECNRLITQHTYNEQTVKRETESFSNRITLSLSLSRLAKQDLLENH